jgi:Zn-dependent membrane protease YugP
LKVDPVKLHRFLFCVYLAAGVIAIALFIVGIASHAEFAVLLGPILMIVAMAFGVPYAWFRMHGRT